MFMFFVLFNAPITFKIQTFRSSLGRFCCSLLWGYYHLLVKPKKHIFLFWQVLRNSSAPFLQGVMDTECVTRRYLYEVQDAFDTLMI